MKIVFDNNKIIEAVTYYLEHHDNHLVDGEGRWTIETTNDRFTLQIIKVNRIELVFESHCKK